MTTALPEEPKPPTRWDRAYDRIRVIVPIIVACIAVIELVRHLRGR